MLIIWVLRIVALAFIVGPIVYGFRVALAAEDAGEALPKKKIVRAGVLSLLGLVFLFWSAAATYVPATQRAVVENTTTGNFKVIGPGIHVFPFQPNLVPMASKVTKYSLRAQRIEIGTEKDTPGVAAGSSSPGNPVVYIKARGWAQPVSTDAELIELHRTYGPGYIDDWVEANLVEAVKAVQGNHPYDYLVNNRNKMAAEIEEAVQQSLVSDERRLARVSQLAIANFDFEPRINELLKEVAQKEFERQKAARDVEIAKQTQEAENVKADTRIQIAKKDGEATVAAAQAEAEAIRVKYSNEAMSQAYLAKQWIEKWNGTLPTVSAGGDSLPIINIPPIAQAGAQ